MTVMSSKLDSRVIRIEVHSTGIDEDDEPNLRWHIRGGLMDEDLVFFGYLNQRNREGFGQAQAIAIGFGVGADLADGWSDDDLREWGEAYVFEPLWDLLRRALQSQASSMDFQLDIPIKATVPEVVFRPYEMD